MAVMSCASGPMWREGKRSVQGKGLAAEERESVIFTKRRVAECFGCDFGTKSRRKSEFPAGPKQEGSPVGTTRERCFAQNPLYPKATRWHNPPRPMRPSLRSAVVFCLLGLAGCSSFPESAPPSSRVTAVPGPTGDGAVRLPTQWFLRPAGKQLLLGDFPVNIALHPAGKFAAVLHCGHGRNEIIIVELEKVKEKANEKDAEKAKEKEADRVVSRAVIDEAFYGLAFSGDGRKLFCSGAGSEVVHSFRFEDGYLAGPEELRIADRKERYVPAGIAVSADGSRVCVASVWGHTVSILDNGKVTAEIPLSTNAAGRVRQALPPAKDDDEAAITKRAEALLEAASPDDPFPYGCALDEKRGRLYVSLWGQSAVAVIDLAANQPIARWPAQEHP